MVEKLEKSAFPAEMPAWMPPRPGTISRLLDRMEDGRLAGRAGSPDNEKAKQVVMTRNGKGRRLLSEPGTLPALQRSYMI